MLKLSVSRIFGEYEARKQPKMRLQKQIGARPWRTIWGIWLLVKNLCVIFFQLDHQQSHHGISCLSLHTRLGAQLVHSTLKSLKGAVVKDSNATGQSCPWPTCIFSPCTFNPKFLQLKPWIGALFRSLCRGLLTMEKGETWKKIPHTHSIYSEPFPFDSFQPWSSKNYRSLLFRAASTLRQPPHLCWSMLIHRTLHWCHSMQKMKQRSPADLDSCLYHCNKWLKA